MWIFCGTFLVIGGILTPIADADLDTAAITVYRNPEFFRHLSEEFNNHLHNFATDPLHKGTRDEYHSSADDEDTQDEFNEDHRHENQEDSVEEEGGDDSNESQLPENHKAEDDDEPQLEQQEEEEEGDQRYKYPGEPKKPNSPNRPNVNVHFDDAPDFNHPPRNLPPPQKPKKKGRGPYGHPRHVGPPYETPVKYSQLYEDAHKKSEEELLADIEEESRRQRYEHAPYYGDESNEKLEEKYEVHPRYPYDVEHYRDEGPTVPLNVYHQGLRYPIQEDGYSDHESADNPFAEQKSEYGYPAKDIRETKKGTREYLKHHKPTNSREVEDLRSQPKKKEKPVIISCDTVVRRKPRKYLAYKVRPVYSHYKIVPIQPRKSRYYVMRRIGRFGSPTPKLNRDNSAYQVNSELDMDYQNLRKLNLKNDRELGNPHRER